MSHEKSDRALLARFVWGSILGVSVVVGVVQLFSWMAKGWQNDQSVPDEFIPHKVINEELNFYTAKILKYCQIDPATGAEIDTGICNEMKYQYAASLEAPLEAKTVSSTTALGEAGKTSDGKKDPTGNTILDSAIDAVASGAEQVSHNISVLNGKSGNMKMGGN